MKTLSDLGLNSEVATRAESCSIHGNFISKNVFGKIWTGCVECASIAKAELEKENQKIAAAVRHYEWQKKLGCAGIPERFQNRTLDTYHATTEGQIRALEFAKSYAENFDDVQKTGRSAIFCGKPGTGKTHLAVGVGLHVMQHHKLVQFTTVQRMIRSIKGSWRNDSELSESQVIAALVEPDFLIIDEIGVQFGTEFEKNAMFDILNERYENRRPVLLLSNLTASEVKIYLGERVYDRLREDGGRAIAFDWESHRAKMK